jgi:hypothetical protein
VSGLVPSPVAQAFLGYAQFMLVEMGDPCELGVASGARISFSTSTTTTPEGPRFNPRQLLLDDDPAFELSFWCGTCAFLFERLSGANEKLSLDAVQGELNEGLDRVEPVIRDAFAALLPIGEYLPLLLEIRPRMVSPGDQDDYFSREQLDTWGVDPFWGLPNYPRTPYYRLFETPVSGGTSRVSEATDGHLFEFAVPMVPPRWNDPDRVMAYQQRLAGSARPTAVALSLLDICQPATLQGSESDYYAHWGLTHFLLDGHHKMQAAAESGLPLGLLTIVSVDHSLAQREDVLRLGALHGQAPVARR